MEVPREDWSYLRALFQFARLITPDETAARSLTNEVLKAAVKRFHGGAEQERVKRLLFFDLRQRALKKYRAREIGVQRAAGELCARTGEARSQGGVVLAAWHRLPEPGRSALGLVYFADFSCEDLSKVLGLSLVETAQALKTARQVLAQNISSMLPQEGSLRV